EPAQTTRTPPPARRRRTTSRGNPSRFGGALLERERLERQRRAQRHLVRAGRRDERLLVVDSEQTSPRPLGEGAPWRLALRAPARPAASLRTSWPRRRGAFCRWFRTCCRGSCRSVARAW